MFRNNENPPIENVNEMAHSACLSLQTYRCNLLKPIYITWSKMFSKILNADYLVEYVDWF